MGPYSSPFGIYLSQSSDNVVQFNLDRGFGWGIWLDGGANNAIDSNIICGASFGGGGLLIGSNFNNVSHNIIGPSYCGIRLWGACNNVYQNTFTDCDFAVEEWGGENNIVAENNLIGNDCGVHFRYPSCDMFVHNFFNNTVQVLADSDPGNSTWDDGYPSGGNYWSGYAGLDLYHGAYQNESGSDGIGDVPYSIDASNIDHYPLMTPWPTSLSIGLISPQNMTYYSSSIPLCFTLTKPASWIGYSLDNQQNTTISSNTIIAVSDGPHEIVIYANDSSGTMVSSEIVHFMIASSICDPYQTSFIGLGNYPIGDFAECNGNLYATSNDLIYIYDGESWNVIQAPTHTISLMSHEGRLLVAGKGGLYVFNGTTFTQAIDGPAYYKMLGTYSNTIYVATYLDNPPKLYYCNGSVENPEDWHVDTGFSTILNFSGAFGSIDSFAEYNGALYLTSGGTVYRLNETGWSTIKTYVDVFCFSSMKVYNGKLYLATRDQGWRKPLYQGGTGFSGRVIEFGGENWTIVLDHDYWIYSLEEYDGKLYAGTANQIFTYNGTDWQTSFNAAEGAYYAISMITYDGKIYVGMGNGYIFADPAPLKAEHETIVVPEFSSFLVLPLFMLVTLLAVIVYRRKQRKNSCINTR
jgi:hypothetical protein